MTAPDFASNVVADLRGVVSTVAVRALIHCATGDEAVCASCVNATVDDAETVSCISGRWRLERRSYQALPPPAEPHRNS
jgi:hypothetical protein